jgi:hypothetical protein
MVGSMTDCVNYNYASDKPEEGHDYLNSYLNIFNKMNIVPTISKIDMVKVSW